MNQLKKVAFSLVVAAVAVSGSDSRADARVSRVADARVSRVA